VNPSVTVNVIGVAFAAAVGVPVIAPVAAFNKSPAGSVPLVNDQLYGVVPPVAASVALYGAPTSPFGSDVVVIASVAGAIVSVRFAVAVSTGLLVSVTVNFNAVALTAVVGVPVIVIVAVVEGLRVSPAGSVPLNAHVYGAVPPVAVNVALYATPTCPLGSVVVGAIVIFAAATTVSVSVATKLCGVVLESVTRIVIRSMLAVCVGVPLNEPVVGFSVRPVGSAPLATAQVYGAAPPVAVSVTE